MATTPLQHPPAPPETAGAARHSRILAPAPAPALAWWIAGLLTAGTLALYWPATTFGFINYDDPIYASANPHVQAGLTLAGAHWAFTTGEGANWHPLTWLSLMLDVTLFGQTAHGMHFTNVVLHALNAALLFALLAGLTRATWRSAWVAALFAWHPAHVESVAWVSERKDVLSFCLGLLSLLFYTRYTRAKDAPAAAPPPAAASPSPTPGYTLALACFALGLLSKPMLVTWPAMLLLLDFWPLQRFRTRPWAQLVWEKTPFMALAAAACVVTFLVQKSGGAVARLDVMPLNGRLINALVSYERYLGKLVWPAGLGVFYPMPPQWPIARVLGDATLLAALTILVWAWRRSRPFLLMGWLWYVITLIPVIGLVQVGTQSIADRYTYIPCVGALVMVVWGAHALCSWRRAALAPACLAGAAALCLCAIATRHQLGFWQSNLILFQHDLAVAGDNLVARQNLGVTYSAMGRVDDAISQYQQALALEPESAETHYDLGNALARQGRDAAAISQFQDAIRLQPDYAPSHNNLGNLLLKQGQIPPAIQEFQAALRLQPDNADTHYNLAGALMKIGRTDDAIQEFQAAIRFRPGYAPAHYNLGAALNKAARPAEAIRQFQEAIRLQPDYALAHNSLGISLGAAGHLDDAIHEFEEALRLKPDYAAARTNLLRAQALKP